MTFLCSVALHSSTVMPPVFLLHASSPSWHSSPHLLPPNTVSMSTVRANTVGWRGSETCWCYWGISLESQTVVTHELGFGFWSWVGVGQHSHHNHVSVKKAGYEIDYFLKEDGSVFLWWLTYILDKTGLGIIPAGLNHRFICGLDQNSVWLQPFPWPTHGFT